MPKVKQPAKKTIKKPVTKTKLAPRVATTPPQSPLSPQSPQSPRSPRARGLSVPVLGTDGKTAGRMALPAKLFAAKVNKQLLAQSVRVYLANQRSGSASTKTRGEVEGSTRKIYKQKGGGRARHGGIRAPIFVGGGITFGPKPRDYSLSLPKKMQRKALASALTSQFREGKILFVDGLADLPPKTKHMAKAFAAFGIAGRTLLVTTENAQSVIYAARNLASVDVVGARSIFPYAVLSHPHIIMMKEAVPVLSETFVRHNPS